MYFEIKPSQIKTAVTDLGEINHQIKKMQMEVDSISHQLKSESNSLFGISDVLVIEVSNLEVLLSKFAIMEDGLERTVELYLQCERRLSGGDSQKALDINVWWNNVKNWIKNGIWHNPKKSDRTQNDMAMATELKTMLQSKKYSKETWKKSSVDERKKILESLLKEMQKIFGISLIHLEIKSIKSEPGYVTYGYYSDYSKLICINEDSLSDSLYDKVMETMAHEMRHAYQYAVVRNPQSYQVDQKTVDEWRDNFKDYKTVDDDGYKAYRDQPIEKDARDFASWVK